MAPSLSRMACGVRPGAGYCAILPWPHVRNQGKRFPREHFTFAREEKRFAGEHFAFAREEKRFAGEHFAFACQQKRFAGEHFAFAREQKRFPRCRRTGVVFRRSLHAPADANPAFFSLGERLVGSSRGVGRALRTHAHYMCVRLRRGRDRGDSSYKQHRRYSKLACKKLVKETSMRIDAGRENSERPTQRETDLRPPKWLTRIVEASREARRVRVRSIES